MTGPVQPIDVEPTGNTRSSPPPLVVLLRLAERTREAGSLAELFFVMVNETYSLAPYRQGVLWCGTERKVVALSGIPRAEPGAPFVLWLRQLFVPLDKASATTPIPMSLDEAPEAIAEGWREWLPPHAIALPLKSAAVRKGWLLLARETPFVEAEGEILDHLAGIYGHAWHCRERLRQKFSWWRWQRSWKWRLLTVLSLGILLAFRIPLTALAPAEVVPSHPEVVRSPMDGVVEHFHVAPNTLVVPGQPLFDLDDTTLSSRLEIAEKSLAIAESEYHITTQSALQDPRSKGQLAILSGRVEEKKLEAEGLRELLGRCRVKATRAGLALFGDTQSWIGRPVVTGEKILTIASEQDVEIEAWIAPGDLIPLPEEVAVTLFLNIDPLHPRTARMRMLAYEAEVRPGDLVSYRMRARFIDALPPPRLGLKGTARIAGETVTVGWWMMRRPIALIRQWLGQ
ncbi:MAG: HlyD family efflux transporter periplasmic adaptor subunit [Magnetococcales bacterium]|nr:HlyD family efflux transporter periplasmic adaptor subunit [Magnetococcales bacterium]